jgi:DNA invertase Pin-like site-specific DNA recombinase
MQMTKHEKPKRAVGYIRVSTDEQAAEGVSLDVQRAKIEAWCELNDFELLDVFADEGISGKRVDNRLGLQDALDRVCREKAALVVLKLERMIRCTRDAIDIAEDLRKAGADLVSLTERIDTTSPMGEFFYVLMAAMAQLERRQIGERTKVALAHMRSNGKRISRFAPFGYRQDQNGGWVEEPHEQEAISLMLPLREAGLSFSKIGEALEVEGFVGRNGQRLSAKVVRSVIRRVASTTPVTDHPQG